MEKKQKLKHVAIIMDGNGRWATSRNRPRFWGHIRGVYRVSDIVEKAVSLNLQAITLYAFSTENWSRPRDEINLLFKLLKKYLQSEFNRIVEKNISFKVIGDISKLSSDTQELIKDLEEQTQNSNGMKLTFCFCYSGRFEIASAVKKFVQSNKEQIINDPDFMNQFNEETFSNYLFRPEIGDVDLLIRTGGEKRISNFLLYQLAYSELYFTDTKWPEFTDSEFEEICHDFNHRERRFGSVHNNIYSLADVKNKAMINSINIGLKLLDQEQVD